MAAQTLTCPKCGKVGTVTGKWRNGNFFGDLMTGLDVDGCEECRATLKKNGYALAAINPDTGALEPAE